MTPLERYEQLAAYAFCASSKDTLKRMVKTYARLHGCTHDEAIDKYAKFYLSSGSISLQLFEKTMTEIGLLLKTAKCYDDEAQEYKQAIELLLEM